MEMRFWTLAFDADDHLADAIRSMMIGHVTCLVDEEQGGIIAYVIDPPHSKRVDEIAEVLNREAHGGEHP
jgi:hypothetical protein